MAGDARYFERARRSRFYSLNTAVKRVWLDVGSHTSVIARGFANLARIFKLRRLLRTTRPDAVLSFIDVPNVLTILASMGLRVRVVVSERNNPEQTEAGGRYAGAYTIAFPWRSLRRAVYRRADVVTALNVDAANWIQNECGVQVEVIQNPLRALPSVAGEREKIVLGVGRLGVEKGFDLLITAFACVADSFPDWRLLIFGAGPERERLLELRDRFPVRERIEIREPAKEIESWMGRSGLVVMPSRFEAYGNAILESLGMGAAVVSTRCSGPSSFITDGVNGRLAPIDDVAALANAMSELMADPQLRESLGKQALRVRDSHRQDVIMERWERCLFPAGVARLEAP